MKIKSFYYINFKSNKGATLDVEETKDKVKSGHGRKKRSRLAVEEKEKGQTKVEKR